MKKALMTVLAALSMVAVVEMPMPQDAEARKWRRHHHHRVVRYYNPPRVRYYRPYRRYYAPAPVYYGSPVIYAPRPAFGVTIYAR
jgi:hypothetical protein